MFRFVVLLCLILFGTIVANDDVLMSPTVSLLHGVELPRLGLGTAGLSPKATADMVKHALSVGYRLLDTAQASEWYSEAGCGQGIQEYVKSKPPSSLNLNVVIVTKIHPRSFAYDKMQDKLIESQEKLLLISGSTSPLDVVLLHSPFCWSGHCSKEEESISWKKGWENLESIKATGIVSNIGVSNFDSRLLRELVENVATVRVSVVQNWMDPFHQDRDTRSFARAHEIAYMAYSSFGTQWEWKLKKNPVLTSSELQRIADKHSRNIPQVVLSWLLQEEVVAIPRSSSTAHITDNAASLVLDEHGETVGLRVFLDDDDMRAIRALDGTLGDLWED